MQRGVCSSSSDTSGEILPLSGVYGHSVGVVGLTAYDAYIFVGKVDRREIVEEVYPVEGMRLLQVCRGHGRRGGRGEES